MQYPTKGDETVKVEEVMEEVQMESVPKLDSSALSSNYLSVALLNSPKEDFSKCVPIGDGRVKCLVCDRELKRDSWKRHRGYNSAQKPPFFGSR